MTGEAKAAILGRIRAALADVPAAEQSGDVAVDRSYRRRGTRPTAEVVEQFAVTCADYRATVVRATEATVGAVIADTLAARRVRRLAIPADLPAPWRAGGVELIEDDGLSDRALSAVDGVVTGCAVAIALNGTIVLDGGAGQGRRALTLLPDYHLCIIDAGQIVEVVPEGIARLHGAAVAGRPMTMIAGPSATSDIELTRVEGVHGPRTLDVVIVGP